MGLPIDKLSVEGFKSLRSVKDFELRSLNLLIGPNGGGKSNFIFLFRLLRALVDGRLQDFVIGNGGPEPFLFQGSKVTSGVSCELMFGANGYSFFLVPTTDNRLIIRNENAAFFGVYYTSRAPWQLIGGNEAESKLAEVSQPGTPARYVYDALSGWQVYHFHDTSDTASVKRLGALNDNESLRGDAANLAALLYRLRETADPAYKRIRDVVRLAAPFFEDFKLRPNPLAPDAIQLEWIQTGSAFPFLASHLSDGTLRFICLATALLQPNPPATLLIDEPELGLHPYAIALVAALMREASARTQIVAATQSPSLLGHFEPEDVVVVDRQDGSTVLRRLSSTALGEWLSEYSLDQLWLKNVIGGGPDR
ncbi:MAG: AAA family ATPase [Deltaproteobacteria bacterium]|nr:AAA family ATPase [Deltaproteobacteria bacterium]